MKCHFLPIGEIAIITSGSEGKCSPGVDNQADQAGYGRISQSWKARTRKACPQECLDCLPSGEVKLNLNCRDEIIPILRALQHVSRCGGNSWLWWARMSIRAQAVSMAGAA